MKWFFLILMAAAAAAIFYFRDEIRGKVDDATSTKETTVIEEVVATGDGTGSETSKSKSGTGGKNPGGTTDPPVKPVDPHPVPEEDPNDLAVKRYPMPKFRTIEEAVGNWLAIPPSAFPRQITINKPVQIIVPGGKGSSPVKAGEKMFALDARSNVLTVGRTNTASIRGQIGIDDTDFKSVLGREFDAWKDRQRAIVMKKRDRYRLVLAETSTSTSIPTSRNEAGLLAYEKELGKKPEQLANGQVPIMIDSLRRKDVNEIKPDIISSWGPVIREVVDDEAYWTATVEYKTLSMFGELNTEAQALMRNGKVVKWIYTGSGESVP